MYERYKNDVAFFVVYIGEAHPSDSWQLPSNIKDQVVYASPTDLAARSELAEVCVVRLGIKLPAIVDRFDDSTEIAWAGRIGSTSSIQMGASRTRAIQDRSDSSLRTWKPR